MIIKMKLLVEAVHRYDGESITASKVSSASPSTLPLSSSSLFVAIGTINNVSSKRFCLPLSSGNRILALVSASDGDRSSYDDKFMENSEADVPDDSSIIISFSPSYDFQSISSSASSQSEENSNQEYRLLKRYVRVMIPAMAAMMNVFDACRIRKGDLVLIVVLNNSTKDNKDNEHDNSSAEFISAFIAAQLASRLHAQVLFVSDNADVLDSIKELPNCVGYEMMKDQGMHQASGIPMISGKASALINQSIMEKTEGFGVNHIISYSGLSVAKSFIKCLSYRGTVVSSSINDPSVSMSLSENGYSGNNNVDLELQEHLRLRSGSLHFTSPIGMINSRLCDGEVMRMMNEIVTLLVHRHIYSLGTEGDWKKLDELFKI